MYWWGYKNTSQINYTLSGATEETRAIDLSATGAGIMTDTLSGIVPSTFHFVVTTTSSSTRMIQYGYGTASTTLQFVGGTGRTKFADFYTTASIQKHDITSEYIASGYKEFFVKEMENHKVVAIWYE